MIGQAVTALALLAAAGEADTTAAGLVRVSQELTAGRARGVSVELVMATGDIEVSAGATALLELDCFGPDSSFAPALEYVEVARAEPAGEDPGFHGQVRVVQPDSEGTDAWQHRWDLRLSRELCRELELALGTGNARFELAGSAVEELYIEVSVGDIILDLAGGFPADCAAECETGAGDILVQVPAGAAVRVEAEAELGRVELPGRFIRSDDGWVSPEWRADGPGLELVLTAAAGDITVVEETEEE